MIQRNWSLLLIATVLLPSVYALNLDSIPVLLLAPIILIVLFLIIFIIMMIKDRLAMKSLAMPTFNNVGKKKTKEEEENAEEKEVKEEIDYYANIKDLEKRVATLNTEPAYKELMKMVRKFFADYLNINYEFTYEELEKELKEKKKNIVFFSKKLSKIEYGPHPIGKGSLMKMTGEFKDIVKRIESQTKTSLDFSKDVKKIKNLINNGKKISKRDLSSAIKLYSEVYSLYHELPSKEKRKLNSAVKEFHKLIS